MYCAGHRILMAGARDSRRKPMIWIAEAHVVTARAIIILAIGWVAAAVAARVGLPPIDRHHELTPRPLETFGTLAICIPASLHAVLLRDALVWLGAVSPRSLKGFRLVWIGTTTMYACLPALIWAATLDPRVPRVHAFFVWLLVYSCAIVSVTLIRHDLAAVLPLLVTVVFTTPRLVPFDHNLLYNDQLADRLTVCAVAALALSVLTYTALGDRRANAVA